MWRMFLLALLVSCSSTPSTPKKTQPTSTTEPARASEELLKNTDFSQWGDSIPEHWVELEGAGGGDVVSKIEADPSGGVVLSGDSSTQRWRVLEQSFVVKPSSWYVLQFDASVTSLQPGPYVNHWVAVAFFDQNKRRIFIELAWIEEGDESAQRLYFKAPEGVAEARVQLFLSQPGRMTVKYAKLQALDESDSFDILVGDMTRRYSYFALKQIDWKALSDSYREKALAAKDPKEFSGVLVSMLGELNDLHISVTTPEKKVLYTVTKNPPPNLDWPFTQKLLLDPKPIAKSAMSAMLAGDIGYFAIFSMVNESDFAQMQSSFESLLGSPGLVIDLRANKGGAEKIGQSMVGRLVDQKLIYGKVAYRTGYSTDRFFPPIDKTLESSGKLFSGKIAVLIGPFCVSSCEGMTMMLKALPNARLFGQTTRGGSGNPQPVSLPNGVTVTYPRWKAMLPDGTPFEGKGLAPDVVVEHKAGADPALEAALLWLQE